MTMIVEAIGNKLKVTVVIGIQTDIIIGLVVLGETERRGGGEIVTLREVADLAGMVRVVGAGAGVLEGGLGWRDMTVG
jgi:hypothetical protein